MTAMKLAWIVLVITLVGCLVTLGILPSDTQVPVHWNIDGEVDKYRSLMFGLLLYPGIMLEILVSIYSFKF